MGYKVYIIQDVNTGRFYIGHTDNLSRRLNEHSKGRTLSLRNKGPFRVVYLEDRKSKQEAYRRELEIKSFKGGIQFKKLLNLPG